MVDFAFTDTHQSPQLLPAHKVRVSLVARGQIHKKIQCIRDLRQTLHCGLGTAKGLVEGTESHVVFIWDNACDVGLMSPVKVQAGLYLTLRSVLAGADPQTRFAIDIEYLGCETRISQLYVTDLIPV